MLLMQPLGCLKVLDVCCLLGAVDGVLGAVDGVVPPELDGSALKSSFDKDEAYAPGW